MRTLDASQRALSRRPRVSRRPRTPSNIYSACPRRPRGVDAAGEPAGRREEGKAGRAGSQGEEGRLVGPGRHEGGRPEPPSEYLKLPVPLTVGRL